jgi:uncharacterized membrane protein YdjX (TVP38/TMEM64 family)
VEAEPRDRPAPAEPSAQRAARLGPRLLLAKALILVALAVAGALLARIPAVREATAPAGHLTRYLRDFGLAAVPIYVGASALLIAVGVPRLLFCPLAGAAFGFWGGLLASTVATMAAYFGSFLFLRGRLADRDEPYELPAQLAFLRHDPGVTGVILTRLLPVPGLLGTVALSLSPVRKRAFFLGSLVGLVPEAVPLILLGAGLLDGSPRHLAGLSAVALVLILACFLLIRRLLRRHAQPPSEPTPAPAASSPPPPPPDQTRGQIR